MLALGLCAVATAASVALAWPVNLKTHQGLPNEGGNGVPVCRTLLYQLVFTGKTKEGSKA